MAIVVTHAEMAADSMRQFDDSGAMHSKRLYVD